MKLASVGLNPMPLLVRPWIAGPPKPYFWCNSVAKGYAAFRLRAFLKESAAKTRKHPRFTAQDRLDALEPLLGRAASA